MAGERVHFQGLPARICWLGYGERHLAGLRFNEMVASGELKAPIVIGRDHLDCGSVASPYRETEAMLDGSDAIADWPLLNALVNTASGATWVSIHHGGGVGIGRSIHAGQVCVADGTELAAQKIERVLTNDPGMGVIRHVDAGYDRAVEVAEERGVRIPMAEGAPTTPTSARASMDVSTFYALFSATCFTLVGLWWNVVQGRPVWMRDPDLRRAVGGVYLAFLLPAMMGLFAQVGGTETPAIWRGSFVIVAVIGVVSTLSLLTRSRDQGTSAALQPGRHDRALRGRRRHRCLPRDRRAAGHQADPGRGVPADPAGRRWATPSPGGSWSRTRPDDPAADESGSPAGSHRA